MDWNCQVCMCGTLLLIVYRAKQFAHYLKTNNSTHTPGLFHSNLDFAMNTLGEHRGLVGCSIGVLLVWILYRTAKFGASLVTELDIGTASVYYNLWYILLLGLVITVYAIVSKVIESNQSIWPRVALLTYSIQGFVPLVVRLCNYQKYIYQRNNKYKNLRESTPNSNALQKRIENGTMLSTDALALIMQHFSNCKELCRASLVCKHWYEASQNEFLWQFMNKHYKKYNHNISQDVKCDLRRDMYKMIFRKLPEKAKFTSQYALDSNSAPRMLSCA